MAGFFGVRRVLLVNALIFAVLAAAVALAYYGYSYASEVSSRDRELSLLHDLADEKVLNIESLIVDADTKLLRDVQLDTLSDLGQLVKNTGAAVDSVFVLDDALTIVPNGHSSNPSKRTKKEALAFRDYFLEHVVPHLPLAKQTPGIRGHVHGVWGGRDYLFSFMKRTSGERTFYVVVEDELYTFIYGQLFPQFFGMTNSPRLYKVVDERGQLVYGPDFKDDVSGELVVERPFTETVDSWVLRVAEKDDATQAALARKHLVDSLLIGGAVAVIVVGLGFLVFAIRRERRLNELKSEFISNVSHELKTPLSIISMFGEMLSLGRTKSPEQAHEYAEIIWRESVRLGRLIDNVLDFAKIERGMGVYEFADGDLAEVVERALELSQRRVQAAEMTLETDIATDLPPVRLDANAYTLAVLNLIDNAIKYAPDGKKILVKLARVGDRLVLSVRDWGQGIDPEEHAKIFDRFYRARAIRLKPIRGSGIGLALVQHIARAHRGEITVESEVGKGSTFSLWVPLPKIPRGNSATSEGS